MQVKKDAWFSKEQLALIGIFQVVKEDNFIEYGLGICHQGYIITLASYFRYGRTFRKAFFPKLESLTSNSYQTFTFDLNGQNIETYQTEGGNQDVGENSIFIKSQLKPQKIGSHKFISQKILNNGDYVAGLIISLGGKQNALTLTASSFEAENIAFLNIPDRVGLHFLAKPTNLTKEQTNPQCLYGFYDNLHENAEGGEDFFLYQESLEVSQAQVQIILEIIQSTFLIKVVWKIQTCQQ